MAALAQGLFDEAQYQQHNLGELHIDKWGRKFRYVQNGGSSALVTGHLLQEPAEDTNYRSMNVATTAAIGAESINVDLGGTKLRGMMFKPQPQVNVNFSWTGHSKLP
jgi:hypothetical protein